VFDGQRWTLMGGAAPGPPGHRESDDDLSPEVEAEMADRLARTVAGEFEFLSWDEVKAEIGLKYLRQPEV
jgi:hypothetical protein